MASALSTAVVSACSRRRTGSASAGTNATSHWIWGAPARYRSRTSLRHTGSGYAIHHAMSVFWATAFEAATRRVRRPAHIGAVAAATAAAAYVVDYHVVSRRLNPGFESRLPPRALVATYVAFAAGLAASRWLRARREAGSVHGLRGGTKARLPAPASVRETGGRGTHAASGATGRPHLTRRR